MSPSIEVDPSNPQRACVVYAADPDNGTALEARIDVLDQPPGSADVQFLNPFHGGSQMAAENGWAHAVWVDYRAGYRNSRIQRTRWPANAQFRQ